VLAPSTLRQVVGLVRSVYSAAVVDRLVTSSPATRLTLPSTHRKRVVPLTVDQVRALAAVMAPRYWAMVIAQAALGLRLGELLALRVDDVDFLRRTVRVEHQVAQKSRELVPPKTPRSKRTDSAAAKGGGRSLGRSPRGISSDCASGMRLPQDGHVFTVGVRTVVPHFHRPPAVARALRHPGSSRRPSSARSCPPGPPATTCATTMPACSWRPARTSSRSLSGWGTTTRLLS
jgi:hypothetical protein